MAGPAHDAVEDNADCTVYGSGLYDFMICEPLAGETIQKGTQTRLSCLGCEGEQVPVVNVGARNSARQRPLWGGMSVS